MGLELSRSTKSVRVEEGKGKKQQQRSNLCRNIRCLSSESECEDDARHGVMMRLRRRLSHRKAAAAIAADAGSSSLRRRSANRRRNDDECRDAAEAANIFVEVTPASLQQPAKVENRDKPSTVSMTAHVIGSGRPPSNHMSLSAALTAVNWKHSANIQQQTATADGVTTNSSLLMVDPKETDKPPLRTVKGVVRGGSATENVTEPGEFNQELLMQIIRCFPFPTPTPSPHSSPGSQKKNVKRANVTGENLKNLLGKRNNNSETMRDKQRQQQQRRGELPKSAPPIGESSKANLNGSALRWMVEMSVDTMAVTALPLDCWLRERLKQWVQLSGHQGTIIPATDHTLWKRRVGTDFNEAAAYRKLMNDIASPLVPAFTNEIEYKGESFIEIEDLTRHFVQPAIMDIKIGTRTFLEPEVTNPVKRKDLYQKMIKLNPNEPTDEEHEEEAVTKLRYMQFRERESSTHHLGFRIEAMKVNGEKLQKGFQKVKTRDQVMNTLLKFMGPHAPSVRQSFVNRLKEMRSKIEQSEFFKTHEVIGSSILFMYDEASAGAWMIDFAKALPTQLDTPLSHRKSWEFGNHEDGYLVGLDNLVQILEDSKLKELSSLS